MARQVRFHTPIYSPAVTARRQRAPPPESRSAAGGTERKVRVKTALMHPTWHPLSSPQRTRIQSRPPS
ncbi:hypothetical protein BDQ17DRAFT_1362554 [Cyathus striatus]|nr:hypothetical protein BDQ17DRAFT_1362554 [Cyathus striatus]